MENGKHLEGEPYTLTLLSLVYISPFSQFFFLQSFIVDLTEILYIFGYFILDCSF